MISYIGSFIILIALLNASLLVLSKPILSKITSDYDSLILSTSKLQFPLVLIAFICLIVAFVNDDFSLKYISSNSNSAYRSSIKYQLLGPDMRGLCFYGV